MSNQPSKSGWSPRQRSMFFRACNAARYDDAHRYILMHHCGCPLDPISKRPSVKHPRNTSHQLELFMSFAEPVARHYGKPISPPKHYGSWEAAVQDKAGRARHKARKIIAEAIERAPGIFDAGLESFVVDHVCQHDPSGFMSVHPESIDQCDAPTVYRVIECLRAFVGRRFAEIGIEPRSFRPPKSALERAKRTG
ncbi:MAG: hypothetical protein ACWA5W_01685 [Phycisphaerales bacterium]